MKGLRNIVLLLTLAAAGCASTGERDPRDPLEPLNRAVYRFNEGLDEAVAKPVATAYRDVVPEPLRTYVRNFFGNIADLFIGVNNILQGKPEDGLQDWMRFAVNSIFGVFGINDVASDMGFEKHNEDFGQTFGRWGVGDGPYLVLPVLGPSTLRDGAGTALDLYFDPVGELAPVRVRNSATVLRFTGVRADLLDAGRLLEEAALDKYVFLRDAYLQRRRSLIYDGRPPRDAREDQDREERREQDRQDRKEQDSPPPAEKRGAAASVNVAGASSVATSGP
jgi:phospholipid-binding lipoprotein MlaA